MTDHSWQWDSITFVPNERSDVDSRDMCDTSVKAFGLTLDVPLITAPMDRVCNGQMAAALGKLGALGIIHCKQPIESQVKEIKLALSTTKNVAAAVGVTGDYKDRFIELVKVGCRIFCLDTANGFSKVIEKAYKSLYHIFPHMTDDTVYFIGGNVATRSGYIYLSRLLFNGVRTGIAGGSPCTTRTATGVGAPTLFSVFEAAREKAVGSWKSLIIADGGVKEPRHLAVALALGADLVMGGYIFAGCDEAPGEVEHDANGVAYKVYRGSASYSVQQEMTGKNPFYVEGQEIRVRCTGPVADVVNYFKAGLRSAMSYNNAKTIAEFKEKGNKNLAFWD